MRREVRQLVARIPLALAVLVGIGIALRVALMIIYRPAILNTWDSLAYLEMAIGARYGDGTRTAGYSMFLDGLHLLSADLEFTIAVQHLVGIATGVILYLTVLRVGAPRWAALAAGAAVWLSFDQMALEHSVMSESLLTLLLVTGLYAAVRALDEPRTLFDSLTSRHFWLVAAGGLMGFAAWTRAAGAPLAAVVALWAALAIPGRAWERVGRAALAGLAGLAVLLVYFELNARSTGEFALTRGSGWVIYARVAPFADCGDFTPPEGTAKLCETARFEDRGSPDDYLLGPASPAREVFGEPPAGDDELNSFAWEVIAAQPFRYAMTVFSETVRYLVPGFHARYVASDYPALEIRRRSPALEPVLLQGANAYYSDETIDVREDAVVVLSDLQQVLRVHPLLMLQSLILGIAGSVYGRGRVRWTIVLMLSIGMTLLIVPSAATGWAARYSIPTGGFFIAAGAIGLWMTFARLTRWRQEGSRAAAERSQHAVGSG